MFRYFIGTVYNSMHPTPQWTINNYLAMHCNNLGNNKQLNMLNSFSKTYSYGHKNDGEQFHEPKEMFLMQCKILISQTLLTKKMVC